MMKARASFILTAVLLLVPQILAQKLPWHPNQEELTGVTRVLLVPPDVRVEKWTTTTGQELEGTAEFVRRTICGTLDQLFEDKKIEVNDYLLCLGEAETSVETHDAIRAVQVHFRELVSAWEKSPHGEMTLESFRLGDELAVTKKLAVDALVVVCANGAITTRGERAMGAIGSRGSAPSQNLSLQIGVIRPHTGLLVFFTQKNIGGDYLKHEERLEQAVEKAVQAAFSPPEPPAKSPPSP